MCKFFFLVIVLNISTCISAFANQALLDAVKQQNVEIARKILAEDATVDVNYGQMIIVVSVQACKEKGQPEAWREILPMLIAKKINVNGTDEYGKSALQYAVSHPTMYSSSYAGRIAFIKMVTAAGADVELRGKDERSALDVATEDDFPEMIKALIDVGAKVNAQSASGKSALHVAVENGSLKAAHTLLAVGADPNIANNEGKTPFETTLKITHYRYTKLPTCIFRSETLPALQPVANPVAIKKLLKLALFSCEQKDPDYIAGLLNNFTVDYNYKSLIDFIDWASTGAGLSNYYSYTITDSKLLLKVAKIIKLLVAAGASFDYEGDKGRKFAFENMDNYFLFPWLVSSLDLNSKTLLLEAALNHRELLKGCGPEPRRSGCPEEIEIAKNRSLTALNIIDSGVNVTDVALENAAWAGNVDVLKAMLAKGAVPSGKSIPLAASNNQLNAIEVLLSAGAEVDVPIPTGESVEDKATALLIAVRNKNIAIAKLLLQAGANPSFMSSYYANRDTPVIRATLNGQVEMIDLLAIYRPDLDAIYNNILYTGTALFIAATNNDLPAVKSLLNAGASVSVEGGGDVLGAAMKTGNQEMVKLLVLSGAK